MAEEKLGDGEVKRRIEALERALGQRVTKEEWERENRHLRSEIDEGDEDCKERTAGVQKQVDEIKKAKKIAWDRVALWASVVVALIAALFTAYAATRGK